MIKHSFQFGTAPIEIFTKKKLPQDELDTIFSMLQFIAYDFTDTIHGSSGYRFNTTPPNTPFPLTSEYLYYLDLCMHIANDTKGLCNPFSIRYQNVRKNILIEEDTCVKKESVTCNAQMLLRSFTMDTIFEYLYERKHMHICVQTKDKARAGKGEWTFSATVDADNIHTQTITDQSIGLFYINQNHTEQPQSFADKDTELTVSAAIIPADTLINAHVRSFELYQAIYKSDFQAFATKYTQTMQLYTAEGKQKTIAPFL